QGVAERLSGSERPGRKSRAERLTFQELRDDVGGIVARSDVVNRQDVRMVECARGLCFLLEAPQAIGILRKRGGEDLDRYLALQPRIARPVDLTHPARAERRQDLVGA